ncbi:MAG: hypothetical protein JWQ72_3735, partial [Polaromonas sp.]|nr:hypothetical protein [Polaromonas sp.]
MPTPSAPPPLPPSPLPGEALMRQIAANIDVMLWA